MKKLVFVFILLLAAMALNAQSIAQWNTSMGMFRAEIREDLVPMTGNNFISLADSNFYDGLIFHRVVAGFVIQDGCPLGTGTGGPGYTIDLEIHPDLRHDLGALAMARSANPNSAGSQYYFTLAPQPGLDDNYAVFGKCIQGMDVILEIGQVEVVNERPVEDVVIDSVRILGVVFPHIEITETQITESPSNSDGDGILNPEESGYITVSFENWEGWVDAEDITLTLSTDDDRVNIITGEVTIDDIAAGSTGGNTTAPFEIETTTPYVFTTELTVTISANPTAEYPYMIDKEIELEVSLHQGGGWNHELPYNFKNSAEIRDINNDQVLDIVAAERNGNILLMDNLTTMFSGFPVELGGDIDDAVAIGNMDGGNDLEIVVGSRDRYVYVIKQDGSIVSQFMMIMPITSGITLADMDNDGELEILFKSIDQQLHVKNMNGSNVPGFPFASSGPEFTGVAVGDINGDGLLDIASGSSDDNLYAVAHDGSLIFEVEFDDEFLTEVALADIDNDGKAEVIAPNKDNNLYIVDDDGSILATVETEGQINCSPALADISGDGIPEIFFGSNDAKYYACDSQGNMLTGFPVDLDGIAASSSVIVDIDGDSSYEIIFTTSAGMIYVLNTDGTNNPAAPMEVASAFESTPAVADIDGDGDLEIVVGESSHLYAMDYKVDGDLSMNSGWMSYRSDIHRTGNYNYTVSQGIESNHQLEGNVKVSLLHSNYPNPFNPVTTFGFTLAEPQEVSLKIYNVKGALVKVLIDNEMRSGSNQVIWDGKDSLGNQVASGVYFYQLDTGEDSISKKMVLMK